MSTDRSRSPASSDAPAIYGDAGNRNAFLELLRAAAATPQARAIVAAEGTNPDGSIHYRTVTFAQLIAEIEAVSVSLELHGIRAGTRVLMLVPPGVELVATVYALFHRGAVPVFLDGGNPLDRILALIAEARAGALIAAPAALELCRAFPDAFATVELAVAVPPPHDLVSAANLPTTAGPAKVVRYADLRDLHASGGRAVAAPPAHVADDDLLAVVFTSGSTGLPKGVEYTPRMFRATIAPLAELFGVGPGDVDLVTFPIYLLGTPTLGATVVVPGIDATRPGHADPEQVLRVIADQKPSYSVGSPAFWNRISQHCAERGVTLPSLRHILVSGAPVPGQLVRRLQGLLPNGTCATPIGATEGAPFASIGAAELLEETLPLTDTGAGVCVGRPVSGHQLRIIEIIDAPLPTWADATLVPDGTIGELVLGGPVTSPRYFARPDATRRAKIVDDDGAVWHRLGDCGYRDAKGRIWYCGRVAHIIQHRGRRYFPIMIEGLFNREPDVYRTALVQAHRVFGRISTAATGAAAGATAAEVTSALVLCLEWQPHARARSAAAQLARLAELRRIAEHAGLPLDELLVHDAFPVDARHNSKIEYEQLAAWATSRLAERAVVASAAAAPAPAEVA